MIWRRRSGTQEQLATIFEIRIEFEEKTSWNAREVEKKRIIFMSGLYLYENAVLNS